MMMQRRYIYVYVCVYMYMYASKHQCTKFILRLMSEVDRHLPELVAYFSSLAFKYKFSNIAHVIDAQRPVYYMLLREHLRSHKSKYS